MKTINIGRNSSNDIIINDSYISGKHAIITQISEEQFKITDNNSTNGTFVNNQKIKVAFLKPNDSLRLANKEIDWQKHFIKKTPKSIVLKQRKNLKKLYLIFSILAILLLAFLLKNNWFSKEKNNFQSNQNSENFKKLVQKVEKSVFLVDAKNTFGSKVGSGSGFFIHKTGIGVSNYHVFEPGQKWYIKTFDGKYLRVTKILKKSKKYDFVIFKVENRNNINFPVLRFAKNTPEKGDEIFVVGNPKGIESTLTKGVVSSLRGDINSRSANEFLKGDVYIQIDAAISSGSSGSPVMNMKGQVVGIATAKIMNCENCNFAVNIKKLKYLLK